MRPRLSNELARTAQHVRPMRNAHPQAPPATPTATEPTAKTLEVQGPVVVEPPSATLADPGPPTITLQGGHAGFANGGSDPLNRIPHDSRERAADLGVTLLVGEFAVTQRGASMTIEPVASLPRANRVFTTRTSSCAIAHSDSAGNTLIVMLSAQGPMRATPADEKVADAEGEQRTGAVEAQADSQEKEPENDERA